MKTLSQLDICIRRTLKHIENLVRPPPFISVNDYQTTLMMMFVTWRVTTKVEGYSSDKFRKLEALIEMVRQFDNTIERPVQMDAVRAIQHDSRWKQIQSAARDILASRTI